MIIKKVVFVANCILAISIISACKRPPQSGSVKSLVSPAIKWPNPHNIPLCFVNLEEVEPAVIDAMKAKIEEQYVKRADVNFSGLGKCPTFTTEQLQATPTIRVYLDVEHTTYDESANHWEVPGGESLLGIASGTDSFDGKSYGTTVSAPKKWVNIKGLRTETEYILLHELGHALGLQHEQLRDDISSSDAALKCAQEGVAGVQNQKYNSIKFGPYEHNSIMNYCADLDADKARPNHFTEEDIQGLRALYDLQYK